MYTVSNAVYIKRHNINCGTFYDVIKVICLSLMKSFLFFKLENKVALVICSLIYTPLDNGYSLFETFFSVCYMRE
jgi:hypothetical protein